MVTYIIVALVHIYATGYALFGLLARILWWWDENKYISDGDKRYQATERLEAIVTPFSLKPYSVGDHRLEKLLSVNLVAGIIEAEAGFLDKYRSFLKEGLKDEYRRVKGIPVAEIGAYDREIDEKVNADIRERLKVGIDKNSLKPKGLLDPDFERYLFREWGVMEEYLEKLKYGESLYRFTTKGLLMDDDIAKLATETPNHQARAEIAVHGLRLQLGMLPQVFPDNGFGSKQ